MTFKILTRRGVGMEKCPTLASAGADLGSYKGGCPIHLKGASKEIERRRHGGCTPLPRKFLYFLYQNDE